uniref:Uncharacterized protein n=1 Tax=Rhizophora mucronata TaxID=61149 RepID=A0A2P2R1F3_RHIMU
MQRGVLHPFPAFQCIKLLYCSLTPASTQSFSIPECY